MADGIARAAFFVLLPAIGAGGALGVPVLLCLAGVASIRPSLLRQAIEKRPLPIVLLLALTAWIALASAWSPYPGAVTQAVKVGLIVTLGLMFAAAAVAPASRRLTLAGGVAAFAVLGALLTIEAATDLSLNRAAQPDEPAGELLRNTGRGATVLLAITWTSVAALLIRRSPLWLGLASAAVVLGGFVALQFGQFANTLAFAAGLAAFAAAYAAPRFGPPAVSSALALWLVVAPFATPLFSANPALLEQVPRSWAERVRIWDYASARILEQPWFGHGLDSARAPAHGEVPLHPHSASLHLWFDTGLVGALLAAVLLVVGGRVLGRVFGAYRPGAAAAAGTLASFGVVANVSYGLWAEWWLAIMFVSAALAGALLPRPAAT